jgi:hypothetical protein
MPFMLRLQLDASSLMPATFLSEEIEQQLRLA